MENGFACCICLNLFDLLDFIPIVLNCGDSACMNCLVQAACRGLAQCFVCGETFGLNFAQLKDLPVNKALLMLLKSAQPPSRFRLEGQADVNPFLEDKELCKRKGCKKFKYEHMNVVYQYCSVRCMQEDQNEEKLSLNT